MNDHKHLDEYYSAYDEDGRLNTRCGHIEYATTMRYIERYLKPDSHIIEIGAATGRYSHALARRGYYVDAVELIEHNIERFRENTQPGENITIKQGNALDLSAYPDNTYDITLILGPLYHLYTTADKLRALSEAIRVTKPGGIVFAAYCIGDASIIDYGFKRGQIFTLIENNLLDTETFDTSSTPAEIFELCRKEDIEKLRSNFDVTPLHYIAADGFSRHMKQTIEEMDEKTYEMYMKYHFSICERQDMVGFSHHTLDIFRKN